MTPLLYAVWLILTVGVTAVSIMKYRIALPGSLAAAVMWFVWAQASWAVQIPTGASEPVVQSYPTLAVVGYLGTLGMAMLALITGVEQLTPDRTGRGAIDEIEEAMDRV